MARALTAASCSPRWRSSPRAPAQARLRDAVQLPAESFDYATWDPVLKQTPEPRLAPLGHPEARRDHGDRAARATATRTRTPRACSSATSRAAPAAGSAPATAGSATLSHRTGLDVDVYYPRLDGLERAARRPDQVDRVLAQELVDRFVNFGAIKVFVGPRVGLSGRRNVVTPLVYHDDHLHVRLSPRRVNEPVVG